MTWKEAAPKGFDLSEKNSRQRVIRITKVELRSTYEASTVTGRDRDGNELTFRFLPVTKVHKLNPEESTITMVEALRDGRFPLAINQMVLVRWKVHLATRSRIVLRFTVK